MLIVSWFSVLAYWPDAECYRRYPVSYVCICSSNLSASMLKSQRLKTQVIRHIPIKLIDTRDSPYTNQALTLAISIPTLTKVSMLFSELAKMS